MLRQTVYESVFFLLLLLRQSITESVNVHVYSSSMRSTMNDFASSACIIKIIKKHLVKKVCERSFIKIPEDSNDIGLISD